MFVSVWIVEFAVANCGLCVMCRGSQERGGRGCDRVGNSSAGDSRHRRLH